MSTTLPKISYAEFVGEEYPCKKKILVKIFSHCYPSRSGSADKLLDESGGRDLDVDAIYLEKLFEEIQYTETTDVDIQNQPSKYDVIQEILDLRNAQEYDAFFFIFLTYLEGGNSDSTDRIYLKDGFCPLQDIYDAVKEVETMRMKPKIFLIQADDPSLLSEKLYPKGAEITKIVKIPQDADRLIIMSDIPQKLANPQTNGKKPSFLVSAFGQVLRENRQVGPRERQDLLTLTARINNKVDGMIENFKATYKTDEENSTARMKVPLVTSTLTKLVKI